MEGVQMSDTPISDSTPHNVADLGMRIRMIERELHAANAIIRQQQLLDEQNLRLQERIKRLEDWKDSAMAVEREWDSNAISTMLGGQLGESQRVVIMREVPRLLERIKRLEEVGDNLSDCADQIGWTSCESPQWIKKAENAVKEWRKAKEDKP
jgi:DNA-binding transcriptional MerR regulator